VAVDLSASTISVVDIADVGAVEATTSTTVIELAAREVGVSMVALVVVSVLDIVVMIGCTIGGELATVIANIVVDLLLSALVLDSEVAVVCNCSAVWPLSISSLPEPLLKSPAVNLETLSLEIVELLPFGSFNVVSPFDGNVIPGVVEIARVKFSTGVLFTAAVVDATVAGIFVVEICSCWQM
jgi:hypothetical protein